MSEQDFSVDKRSDSVRNKIRIKSLEMRVNELEENARGSFSKVEDHIKRILVVIDQHTQMIERNYENINELRRQIEVLEDRLPGGTGVEGR